MGGLRSTQHDCGGGVSHSLSFLLGALLPTVLLFFLASDRVDEQLSSISTFRFGNGSAAHQLTSHAASLPTDVGDGADEKEESFPGLAELLPRVAMDDGTVIITSVNEAFARPGSLLDLFRGSFRDGEGIAHLLNHTLIVAADPGALALCEAVHPHCYLLQVMAAGVSSANGFLTRSYLELVWSKLTFQHRVLQLGYNYLYTDLDVMWLRNPFRHISLYADMAISTDRFNGDAEDLTNAPNTGFYYVRSTNRTVEMLRRWRAARSRFRPKAHDQEVFEAIKGEFVGGELQIKLVFLDTALFDGFCEYHGEMDRVCTMHANCCLRLVTKLHDLRNVVADWKRYSSLTPPEKMSSKLRWTYPAKCAATMKIPA
uniref:Nucleotide-diphospho-sugar transferase domain-containing protein n=1 Tax=Aegilops tauschii subsp. strangulata TaxID=200361 RepID=A0A453GBX2_AEGTS